MITKQLTCKVSVSKNGEFVEVEGSIIGQDIIGGSLKFIVVIDNKIYIYNPENLIITNNLATLSDSIKRLQSELCVNKDFKTNFAKEIVECFEYEFFVKENSAVGLNDTIDKAANRFIEKFIDYKYGY